MTEDQIMESGEVVQAGPGGDQITFERFTEWMKSAPAEAKALMGQFMDKVETVAGKLQEGTPYHGEEAAKRARSYEQTARDDERREAESAHDAKRDMAEAAKYKTPRDQLDELNFRTAQQALNPQPKVLDEDESEEAEIIQNAL